MDPLMTKAEPWNMPPASEGSATSDTGRTLVVNTGGVNLPNLGK